MIHMLLSICREVVVIWMASSDLFSPLFSPLRSLAYRIKSSNTFALRKKVHTQNTGKMDSHSHTLTFELSLIV